MPILDHFNPPLSLERDWRAMYHAWAATLAGALNRRLLPENYFAAPNIRFGPSVEIDLGTFERAEAAEQTLGATAVISTVFPDTVEVLIMHWEGGPQVVAAIELVSPSNKDRPATRRAFVAKMSGYLQQGIALSVIDLVTTRSAHLHNEWIEWMQAQAGVMQDMAETPLYANSYRAVWRDGRDELEMCLHTLRVGEALPVLALFLRGDAWVEVRLGNTYLEACENQRIML